MGLDPGLEYEYNYAALGTAHRDFDNQGWNFSVAGLDDDDLLFGVLGSAWP